MKHWGAGGHLGDALFAISYLLRCEQEHVVYVQPEYVHDLSHLVAGTRVSVRPAHELPAGAEDTWMANGRHEGSGLFFRNQEDIMGFIFEYLNAFGKAWNERADMLFDFSWLKPQKYREIVLVINSQPMSGQSPGYSQEELNALSFELGRSGYRVVSIVDPVTNEIRFSLTQIAVLSSLAHTIIGGASGPWFVTMNTVSKDVPRIVILDPMVMDYGPSVGPIHTVKNAAEAREKLREMGYLRYAI